jgi:hypothetical protein
MAWEEKIVEVDKATWHSTLETDAMTLQEQEQEQRRLMGRGERQRGSRHKGQRVYQAAVVAWRVRKWGEEEARGRGMGRGQEEDKGKGGMARKSLRMWL